MATTITLHKVAEKPQTNTYKAWRVYVDSNDGGTDTVVGDINLDGKSSEPGTPFSSPLFDGSYNAANAFSGNNTLDVAWAGGTGHYVGKLFITPIVVTTVTITGTSNASLLNQNIKDFKIQGSHDTTDGNDGTWIDIIIVTDETGWAVNEDRSFIIPFTPALPNALYLSNTAPSATIGHRAWRVLISAVNGGSVVEIAEIDFLGAGNPDTIIFSSEGTGTYTADKAFDGILHANNSWSSADPTTFPQYIGGLFSSSVNVTGIVISCMDSFNSPRDFIVQYSDDTTDGSDGAWVDALTVTSAAVWSTGESRTYNGVDGNIDNYSLGLHMITAAGDTVLSIPDRGNTSTIVTTSETHVVEVADITARDALVSTVNGYVKVLDATSDPTVDSGGAMYFYDPVTDTYTRVDGDPGGIVLEEEGW